MPELPEVEVYRRYIEWHTSGQKIASVDVLERRILGTFSRETLVASLPGHTLRETRRHGKHLFLDTRRGRESVWLHIHFGMSGDIYFADRASESPSRYPKVVLHFKGGSSLSYDDPRLFGRVNLVDSPDDFIAAKRLGPDALDDPSLNRRTFTELLTSRRGAVKALLMKQEVIAGIGNLYADEMLFQSSIDPRRDVKEIPAEQVAALFRVMRPILRTAIRWNERETAPPGDFLFRHRDTEALCPRCGGDIRATVVGGRTTYYCSRHQR